ncbi:hypothetical protein [Dasania marina]|uniref:hypothetical protein n=1 Tax=Dasania marina TaxID=471499 RepID=UPI0030DD6CC3|tara:strand:+ start:2324 stop:2944 length:621 start_codon:yes stop_codon:yes gene_type:complete
MTKTKAFDIPAINNQKEALAIHLGIDSDDDEQFKQISELGVLGFEHSFAYKGKKYTVEHSRLGVTGDRVVNFNSNNWVISDHNLDKAHKTCHNFNLDEAMEVVWDALNGFRENCIPEGVNAHDSQWEDIGAAMTWVQAGINDTPDEVDEDRIEAIWVALHSFREDCIPEGDESYDSQWDEITTAMSWIEETLSDTDADLPTESMSM